MTIVAKRSGRYAGKSAEQRRYERRTRFLQAGRTIWVDNGWAAVTMRAVCVEAGLIDRYFYESFRNTDDLLCAIWEALNQEALDAMLADFDSTEGEPALERLRSAIAAFIRHLACNAEDARLLYGDHAGCVSLVLLRREARGQSARLLVDMAGPLVSPDLDGDDVLIRARMAIGGIMELVASWQAGEVDGTVEDVIDHGLRFATSLAADLLPEPGRDGTASSIEAPS